jgi:hypothetical protein
MSPRQGLASFELVVMSNLGTTSHEIGRRANMHIPGGLIFTGDVVPRFRNVISLAASQKNPILALG